MEKSTRGLAGSYYFEWRGIDVGIDIKIEPDLEIGIVVKLGTWWRGR
jgi:hypothetical protein